MSLARPAHVALVDASGTISAAELAEVAGTLNQQVQADFAPAWQVAATIGVYPTAPPDMWKIELRQQLPAGGSARGYHTNANNQPFALVDVDVGQWTVTASHELLEMLGDPFGNRLHDARALPGWGARARGCAISPSSATRARVSATRSAGYRSATFSCRAYRRTDRGTNRDSFLGKLTSPLEVGEGGYISFIDPADQHVWQRFVRDGQVQDNDWGVQQLAGEMLRGRSDQLARRFRAGVLKARHLRLGKRNVPVAPPVRALSWIRKESCHDLRTLQDQASTR